MNLYQRIRGYIRLIRPIGPLIFGLSVILGEIIACHCVPSTRETVLGFTTAFFLTSSAFVLNDYLDVEIDRINVPNRPLVQGTVSQKAALRYTFALLLVGLLLSALLSIQSLVFAFLAFLISVLYNIYGKKTGLFGNLMVSFCVSISLPFGAQIRGNISNPFVIIIALLIFLSNTGREITKGIADAQGDQVKNVKSVALVYGTRRAAIYASFFYLSTIILGPFFFQTIEISTPILLFLTIIAEAGFLYSSYTLIRSPSRDQALKVNSQINIWMIILLLVLLLNTIQNLL